MQHPRRLSPFPFVSSCVFFRQTPCVQTYVYFAPSVESNILLCVWDVTKIFTAGEFPHVLKQNVCTLSFLEEKGQGDGPGKVAMGLIEVPCISRMVIIS